MNNEKLLRQQLAKMLDWGEAHVDFQTVLDDLPFELQGRVPDGMPHSAWQLLEHMRIASWDIVEFSRGAQHKSPKWPEGYWPATVAPPDNKAWKRSVDSFLDDLEGMRKLISDPKRDLFEPLAHGSGQTLLREALLAADHNAYHLGQLVLVRKALGAWKG
jgi:hypothetical protein